MIRHLNLKEKDINRFKDVYVCKHHWDWDVLHQFKESGKNCPWNLFICAQKYSYLYEGTNEVCKSSTNQLYFAPSMSTQKINDKLRLMTYEHHEFYKNSAPSFDCTAARKFRRDISKNDAAKSSQLKMEKNKNFEIDRQLPRNYANWKNKLEETEKVIEALKAELDEFRRRGDELTIFNKMLSPYFYEIVIRHC